jgi:hypothetical protein
LRLFITNLSQRSSLGLCFGFVVFLRHSLKDVIGVSRVILQQRQHPRPKVVPAQLTIAAKIPAITVVVIAIVNNTIDVVDVPLYASDALALTVAEAAAAAADAELDSEEADFAAAEEALEADLLACLPILEAEEDADEDFAIVKVCGWSGWKGGQ